MHKLCHISYSLWISEKIPLKKKVFSLFGNFCKVSEVAGWLQPKKMKKIDRKVRFLQQFSAQFIQKILIGREFSIWNLVNMAYWWTLKEDEILKQLMEEGLTASKIRIKEDKFQKLTLGASQIAKFKQKKRPKSAVKRYFPKITVNQ